MILYRNGQEKTAFHISLTEKIHEVVDQIPLHKLRTD